MGKLRGLQNKDHAFLDNRRYRTYPLAATLDSPTVLSQLVTPPPHTSHTVISHIIGTASAFDDTYDD